MTDAHHSPLDLLLVPDDEHEPTLNEGLDHDSAADESKRPKAQKKDPNALSFLESGESPNSIRDQMWGVVLPHDKQLADELRGRVQPLLDHRASHNNLPIPPRVFTAPPPGATDKEIQKWVADEYYKGDILDVPRYLLLLGDQHETPQRIQEALMHETFIGRLAFRDHDGYDAYVEKLIKHEKKQQRDERSATFYTVHDGTGATRVGSRALVNPVHELAASRPRFPPGALQNLGKQVLSPDDFMRAAGQTESGVMFSMSHGAGAPRRGWQGDRATQLAHQGAMSFGREGKLYAKEIGDKQFLKNCFWFMFACFGAGTPKRSKFHHWLKRLNEHKQFRGRADSVLRSLPEGDAPGFTAALPQAALANPNGPIAFFGHLDLAWTYSFLEFDTGEKRERPDKYYNLLREMMQGSTAGVALFELARYYNEKIAQLTKIYDRREERASKQQPNPAEEEALLGHLWMIRQDLLGYVLLGDPAARLNYERFRGSRVAASTDASAQASATVELDSKTETETEAETETETETKAENFTGSTEDPAQASEAEPEPDEADAPSDPPEAAPSSEPATAPSTDQEAAEVDPVADAPSQTTRPPSAPASSRARRGLPRAGDFAGEVELEQPGGQALSLRWRARWKLD